MKRYNPFNYGCTWWGIAHFIASALCIYWIVVLIQSDQPLFLKIVGCILIVLAIGEIMMKGVEFIKKGISQARCCSDNYLIAREKRNI